jgi:hypothetical protein
LHHRFIAAQNNSKPDHAFDLRRRMKMPGAQATPWQDFAKERTANTNRIGSLLVSTYAGNCTHHDQRSTRLRRHWITKE